MMNKYPPPSASQIDAGMQCATEVENPAIRALRVALDRTKENRRYQLENFNEGLLAHARCIAMYDAAIETLNKAIATLDPRAAGEAKACEQLADAARRATY